MGTMETLVLSDFPGFLLNSGADPGTVKSVGHHIGKLLFQGQILARSLPVIVSWRHTSPMSGDPLPLKVVENLPILRRLRPHNFSVHPNPPPTITPNYRARATSPPGNEKPATRVCFLGVGPKTASLRKTSNLTKNIIGSVVPN